MSDKQKAITSFFGRAWRGVDAARRAFVNLLFVAFVIFLLVVLFSSDDPKIADSPACLFDDEGPCRLVRILHESARISRRAGASRRVMGPKSMAVAMVEGASRAVACMNQRELAQAQTVPSTMQSRSPRNTFKQEFKRTSGAGLVQYAG